MHLGKSLGALATTLTVVAVLAGGRPLRADDVAADAHLLKQFGVGADGPGLLAFFRSRSLTDRDREELAGRVRDLGSDNFRTREAASARLVRFGPPALPFLRNALASPDQEVARRAGFCIEEIERGPGPALPAAAVRLLASRPPAGAVEALLDFLPFNDDEGVEEEALNTLSRIGVHADRIEPALPAALADARPARRAAAAYVVGQAGDTDQRAAVRKLLGDADPRVRLRAAQGLVSARDRSAVPVLIGLLADAPLPVGWQAEELLCRIAGDKAPVAAVGAGDADSRRKSRDAWLVWWRDQGLRTDLSGLEDRERLIGLTVVAELDTNSVWECGLDGTVRWKLTNLQGPMDVQVLPGGRVLVAENQGQRVTERDLQGHVLWEKRLTGQNPIACQRLPNGNTFIATYQGMMEVTRDGREVFSSQRAPGFFVFGAQRLRNGHTVYISGQGAVTELDAEQKELRTLHIPNNGGWCAVEALPNGHFLVAFAGNNRVAELDLSGKSVWECTTVSTPCSATRLPNGNTLVASMGAQRVVEVDRAGKAVWSKPTGGRPFRVHRR
jgi:hypothetical protein